LVCSNPVLRWGTAVLLRVCVVHTPPRLPERGLLGLLSAFPR
jgi:hypothetical protein